LAFHPGFDWEVDLLLQGITFLLDFEIGQATKDRTDKLLSQGYSLRNKLIPWLQMREINII
jgi:hypothetical protein